MGGARAAGGGAGAGAGPGPWLSAGRKHVAFLVVLRSLLTTVLAALAIAHAVLEALDMPLATGKFRIYALTTRQYAFNAQRSHALVHALALLAYALCFLEGAIALRELAAYHVVLFAAWVVYHVKRIAEALFVHTYSAGVPLSSLLHLCAIHMVSGFALGLAHNYETPLHTVREEHGAAVLAGSVVFAIGQSMVLYHHLLLARLRRHPRDHLYKVPRDGLFSYVSCPHYLFEIISWVGFALISRHETALAHLVFVAVHLALRARRTNRWYRDTLSSYPVERRALVPFVF